MCPSNGLLSTLENPYKWVYLSYQFPSYNSTKNKFLLFYLSEKEGVFFKTDFQSVEFSDLAEVLLFTGENVTS